MVIGCCSKVIKRSSYISCIQIYLQATLYKGGWEGGEGERGGGEVIMLPIGITGKWGLLDLHATFSLS